MKVAMIGHKAIPSGKGGIEKALTSLCPRLVKLGADVTCYNRSSDKPESRYSSEIKDKKFMGVKLKSAPTLKFRGIAAMLASYTAAVRAAFGNYDIVHFHAEGPCAAIWIPKLFGKRCVATVHGLDWQREKWGSGFASKYIKYGERNLVKYADEVIVLSESAKEYFEKTYSRKTVIIHNGTEKPVIREADRITSLYGLHKHDYICVISRLTAEKGIHYLIDAFIKAHTGKKLVIAGDTSDTDDYVALIKDKAKNNPDIIFTGFVTGEVLDELYSNAYAVCLPSDLEGMSLSLLEAFAYGNAVLCSDIPENTSVAGDNALYFEKGNTEDLAQKLKYLCQNSEKAQGLRKDAAPYIFSKYSWDKTAEQTLNIYRDILKNSGKDIKNT